MQTFIDDGDHFIHVVGLLSFRVCVGVAGWPVLVEVVLLHRENMEVFLKVSTVHNEFVLAAILIAGQHVLRERPDCRFVSTLHYAEGEHDGASDDRLVGLPTAYEE